MGKWQKFFNNPEIFFRDYLLKRHPLSVELPHPQKQQHGVKEQEDPIALKRNRQLHLDSFFDAVYRHMYGDDLQKRKPFMNIGAGSFRHKFWTNVDKKYDHGKGWVATRRNKADNKIDIEWDMTSTLPLNAEDNSCEIVYCSHVIEHVWDDNVEHLLNNIYRVLKDGGLLRITCPDADIYKSIYERKDIYNILYRYIVLLGHKKVSFLRSSPTQEPYQDLDGEKMAESLLAIVEAAERDKDVILSEFMLSWFSLLRTKGSETFLAGEDAVRFFQENSSFLEALTVASQQSSREQNRLLGCHVNWFNYEKLSHFLEKAGFRAIARKGYLQTDNACLMDARYFDGTDKEVTLYVECRK